MLHSLLTLPLTYSINSEDELREQFEEFQEDSKELEAELESQLEQTEKKVSDLSKIKQGLEMENDKLKVSFKICYWSYEQVL